MLIGTMDCCDMIPLSVTLTLAGGHKVSAKLNLLGGLHFIQSMVSHLKAKVNRTTDTKRKDTPYTFNNNK